MMGAPVSLTLAPITSATLTPSITAGVPAAVTRQDCSVLRLTVLGTYSGLASPRDVAVVDSRVFITESGGLRVIDASDPASPVEAGFLAAPEGYRQILIGAENAIAARDNSVELIDLSSPDAPTRAGSVPTSWMGPIQLAWDGRFAAARDRAGDVHILEVSAGHGLREVSTYDPPGKIWGGEILGNEMFARLDRARAMGLATIAIDDAFLYVADLDGGLRIVSLSQAGEPTEKGARMASLSPSNAVMLGTHLFVFSESELGAAWSWRVWQFDDSVPRESAEPAELGTLSLDGQTDAVSVCSYLSAFFSLAMNGQSVEAIADDLQPGEVAGALMGVAFHNDKLYLLDPDRGLVVLAVEPVR
jgi:hypothetical protein